MKGETVDVKTAVLSDMKHEIETANEVVYDLNLLSLKEMEILGKLLNKCFAMLTKLIG